MFTLICCSLAGLKMSLRTGFCCRNFLAQDKIKARRKLYLSLPHIGILGVPSPNCMLRLQFWDGALLPPAVLGWHLLTCNILPPDLRWHLLTSNILPPDVRWHLLTLKITFFTGRFAHLLNCNIVPPCYGTFSPAIFYRQICDGTFSPAIFYRQMCDGTFSPAIFYRQICDGTFSFFYRQNSTFSPAIFYRQTMAPSHLQYFTARCAMAPSHLQYFTARFAMAPYHLEHAFYRQICDSTFSP